MGGFAVGRGSPLSRDPEPEALGAAAPEPFWDSLGGAVGPVAYDQARSMEGAHEADFQASLWERHRAAEKAIGRKLPLSHSLTGEPTAQRDPLKNLLDAAIPVDRINAAVLGRPGVLSDDDYEAELAKATQGLPSQFETRGQILAGLQARWNTDRATADAARAKGAGGMIGGFIGDIGGTMADPRQAALAVATGGLGAARPLATRMLAQAGVNSLAAAISTPDKVDEAARLGGPEYGVGDAALETVFAGVGGAGFELGGALLKGGLRGLRGLRGVAEPDPALRGALHVAEQGARDDAAIGPLAGEEYDAASQALATGSPPPRLEPDRDLVDMFSPEAGGGPDVAMYKGRPIYAQAFEPADLATDAARFQYKADADGQGVTARLKGVEAWDPLAAGRLMIWESREGVRYVADGHQRFGLVTRLNDDRGFEHQLDGYLFREADGWKPEAVRTVAALKNIREGSGSPLDAAKVFRDAPDALTDRSLPMTGDFMGQARGLAQLSDEAFGAVINKVIPERYASDIGAMAAHRPDLHAGMVRLMREADPANADEARALVVEALQDDWIRTEGDQADLFGYDPSSSAMIGRAKVAASVKRSLARDARLFNGLIRNADAIEAGGNALARDANQARLAVDRAALEVTAKLALRSGPIGDAMAAAAKKVMAGETPATAAKDVLAKLRGAIEAGERLDDLRGVTLDPPPPGAASDALLKGFDDPNGEGAKGQLVDAPEDADAEPPPGLFDDLPETGSHEKAHQALLACAPGV